MVVAIRELSVELGGHLVLKDVHLDVTAGEILALVGVNGAGKSTLLRCLAGLLRPTSGQVTVLGSAPDGAPAFWRDVAFVAEEPSWYPGLTVREHLELVGITHGVRDRARIDAVVDEFGLRERAEASPITLSSGQRRRVMLAAALLRPSRLLLLDEPEQALDSEFRSRLGGRLSAYADGGGSVVLAAHDAAFVRSCSARQAVVADGQVDCE
ncbi:heme ABC exporter ATP-binding protein CcmA [Allocatelliglobosispora scoriae]|nr:heme ABC exporter ATP-binding protein CcmA [Allocatelliglobosispora scoriae]